MERGGGGRQVGRVTPREFSNLLATYRARQFLRETPPDGEVDPRVTSNLSIFPRVTKSVKLRRRRRRGGRRTRFPREYVLSSSKVSVSKHQDAIFKKSHCEEGGI